MNLRKNIFTSLLIAIGYILHQIVPGTIGGMKFDIMLAVVFVCLFINRDIKNALLTAMLAGMITAMTTTFPGGQIPNIIDKLVTCGAVYIMINLTEGIPYRRTVIGIISFVGTIISGSVFLLTASFISGLPASMSVLLVGIVLPTAVTNIFVTITIYQIVIVAMKVSSMRFIDR